MSCQVTLLPLSLPAWLSTVPEEKDQCDREDRGEVPDSMSYQLLHSTSLRVRSHSFPSHGVRKM